MNQNLYIMGQPDLKRECPNLLPDCQFTQNFAVILMVIRMKNTGSSVDALKLLCQSFVHCELSIIQKCKTDV